MSRTHRRSAGKGTRPAIPSSLQPDDRDLRMARGEFDPGAQVGHAKVFDIVESIGEGGMGRVYKAFDPVMDRYVAMKVLKADVPANERERFRREAVIAANFSHPNLPRVLDRGTVEAQGLEWMTLEFLRGRDLGAVIDHNRRVALPLVVDIFSQTLDALDYMHTRGIVHCDVKPDNIFITRDPYDRRLVIVKLIDFGICRRVDEEAPPRLMGDPRYMSPEQTYLGRGLDGRADLYALGLTLFETLVGLHPYPGADDVEPVDLLRMQRSQVVPSLLDVLPELPDDVAAALDGIIVAACAKDPEERFSSPKAMKVALGQVLER
ncbi:MAG: serine/threonine-protein kinase [Nannocystales bacterium]